MTRGSRWLLASILVVGLTLCAWLFASTLATASIAWHWHAGAIAMLAVLYVLGLGFSCALWKGLTANAGLRVSWKRALVGLGALLMGKYVPGKVFGMLGRAASISKATGRFRIAALILAEQAYALIGVLLVSLVALFLGSGRSEYAWAAAVALGLPFALPYVVEAALRRASALGKHPMMVEWEAAARRFSSLNVVVLLALPVALALTSLSTAAFVPDLLGLDISWQARSQLVGCYGLAVLGGAAVIVLPSGIGVRELGFVALSSPLIGGDHAIAIAALLRLTTVVTDVLTGIFSILLVRTGFAD